MRSAILAFAAGIVVLQRCAELPSLAVLAGLFAAAVLFMVLPSVRRNLLLRIIGGLLLGFAWAGMAAQHRLAETLAVADEGRDLDVVGVIAALPHPFERGVRFVFDVERANAPVPSRVSLAWYRGWRARDEDVAQVPKLKPGQRWHLTVRLKRPHGSLNPHGFDYEAWLLERDIRATGYVRAGHDNARLDDLVMVPDYLVERLRLRIRDRFQRVLADAPYGGILVALAIGDQQSITPAFWRTFARTGVTHLLSVSGLHITMVAGLAAWLVGWAWRRSAWLALRLPAQKAAALAGFLAALMYSLLAGFAVPSQRTLYMLAVVALALWTGRITAVSRVLAVALLLVLLVDPWSVLAAGFWLSFGAVGLLFYIASGRLSEGHWLAAWTRAQWAVTIGMIPALLALFQQFSLVSPLANAVAIPVVSLVVTPLALLGTLPFADPLLRLAHVVVAAVMTLLDWLATSPWAVWQQQAPPEWAAVLGVAGVAWLLLPKGFPARWLGAAALLPLVLVLPPRPGDGEATVTVLDVGQGLAVHVQTAKHDVLYDAGPAFTADADAGSRIILPYFRAMGVRKLDAMVISHADKDHEGGAESVAMGMPVALLLSSLPAQHPLMQLSLPRRRCQDGDRWQWDGVGFEFLHPTADDYKKARRSGNDLSCVLKITASGRSLMLTGDITARSEVALLARHGADVAADVLLPPHHGSKSSSTEAFVVAVSPRQAVFSAGYRNRFGHPAAEVVKRYRLTGSKLWRTDRQGAVTVKLAQREIAATAEIDRHRRYWYQR